MSDKSMRNVIKGVVVDHRLPNDINLLRNESPLVRQRWSSLHQFIRHKFITHTYYTVPVAISVGFLGMTTLGYLYKAYVLGKNAILLLITRFYKIN